MEKRNFQSRIMIFILLFSLPLVAARSYTPDAPGATINVTTTADEFGDDPSTGCSLREAIQAANMDAPFGGCAAGAGADEIILPSGDYHLTRDAGSAGTFENSNMFGDLDVTSVSPDAPAESSSSKTPSGLPDLQINGAGMETTIIDGSGIDRVLEIQLVRKVHIQNLTIQNGKTPDDGTYGLFFDKNGGGISNRGVLSLFQVRVQDNSCGHGEFGGHGGGIFNTSHLMIDSSLILRNRAGDGGSGYNGGNGGGIYSSLNSSLDISASVIAANSAGRTSAVDEIFLFLSPGDGGGIYHDGYYGNISLSTIANNQAGENRDPTPKDTTGGNGGGIFVNSNGSLTIDGSTILSNHAGNSTYGRGGSGGGVFNLGALTVSTSTVSGNTTGYGISASQDGNGGGLFGMLGTILVNNSTIASNNAGLTDTGAHGGGIYNNSGPSTTTLLSTILADNTLRLTTGSDCYGTLASSGWNLIEDVSDSCTIPSMDNLIGLDPKLGPLSDNGGTALTHYLFSDSPAIDAGSNAGTNCPSSDQRTVARPQDGDNNGTATCDIGAYEVVFGELPAHFFLPLIKR